jgi:hypothetical protein
LRFAAGTPYDRRRQRGPVFGAQLVRAAENVDAIALDATGALLLSTGTDECRRFFRDGDILLVATARPVPEETCRAPTRRDALTCPCPRGAAPPTGAFALGWPPLARGAGAPADLPPARHTRR